MRRSAQWGCVATAVGLVALGGCLRDFEVPPPPSGGAECFDDTECEWGLCRAGLCDALSCNTDTDCQWGLCDESREPGFCNTFICREDADCSSGTCRTGRCASEGPCTEDFECPAGICEGGGCQSGGCRTDADCSDDWICLDLGGEFPLCAVPPTGPPLLGNPDALTMLDNLEAAHAWILDREPAAGLIQITGLGIDAAGTVDIDADNSNGWMYHWEVDDGGSPRFLMVFFSATAGRSAGHYDDDAGNVSSQPELPPADRTALLDSSTLVGSFAAEPGCVAPTGQVGDAILYQHESGEPIFRLSTAGSHFYLGNPVTGVATAFCD